MSLKIFVIMILNMHQQEFQEMIKILNMNAINVWDSLTIQRQYLFVHLVLLISVKDVNGISIRKDMNVLIVMMEQYMILPRLIVQVIVAQFINIQLMELWEMMTRQLIHVSCHVHFSNYQIHLIDVIFVCLITVKRVDSIL